MATIWSVLPAMAVDAPAAIITSAEFFGRKRAESVAIMTLMGGVLMGGEGPSPTHDSTLLRRRQVRDTVAASDAAAAAAISSYFLASFSAVFVTAGARCCRLLCASRCAENPEILATAVLAAW